MSERIYPVIIIGGGPAALTAALYTARANLSPLVLAGAEPGGQLMLTSLVENWPGTTDGIMGPELMQNMMDQVKKFGAELKFEKVTAVDFSPTPFSVTVGGTTYQGKAVIIATGAAARWLGIPGEAALIGKGVSSCANCDAAFFKDKVTGVVGGGDAACEDALALTKFASEVHLFVRASEFRASKIMTDRVQHHAKITIHYHTEVTAVLGDQTVSGVRLKNNQTSAESTFDLQGLFVAIGHTPATDIFRGQIEIDDHGFVKMGPRMTTSVPGVFVAGDVEDWRYKQAITAAGDGCRAALEAEWWIEGKKQ
ncbi:MAG: thioredoxin-disulfide reductase [Patescibacteria group bacterium]